MDSSSSYAPRGGELESNVDSPYEADLEGGVLLGFRNLALVGLGERGRAGHLASFIRGGLGAAKAPQLPQVAPALKP